MEQIMMRKCSTCKTKKILTDFHKCKSDKLGISYVCKTCSNKKSKIRNAIYFQNNKEKIYARHLEWRKKNPEKVYQQTLRSRRKSINKHCARYILQNSFASGKIQKQPCMVCGVIKVQAHHEDYTKPLDVLWLCQKHHRQLHKSEKVYNKLTVGLSEKASANSMTASSLEEQRQKGE